MLQAASLRRLRIAQQRAGRAERGAEAVGEGTVEAGKAVVGGTVDAGKAVVGGAAGALKAINPFDQKK